MSSFRDDFSALTKRTLAARFAFKCSNPKCKKLTISPSIEALDKITSDGAACHITAASLKGPRYDANLAIEERQSITNGITGIINLTTCTWSTGYVATSNYCCFIL